MYYYIHIYCDLLFWFVRVMNTMNDSHILIYQQISLGTLVSSDFFCYGNYWAKHCNSYVPASNRKKSANTCKDED